MQLSSTRRVEEDPKPAPERGVTLYERRLGRALTIFAIVLYPLLIWRGWGGWNDVLVDYGRELYVPWRLSEGDVLYRDLAYFNGPLSPYWNALIFRIAGTSLRVLTIANIVTTALFAVLLHQRVERAGGPIAAGAGLVAFFTIFACGHFPGVGNYNFLAPYSHELTHGLLLGLMAFSTGLRGSRSGGDAWALATGLLLGLVFLTKAEVFLGSAAAVAWLFVLRWPLEPQGALRRIGGLVAGLVFVPALACVLLGLAMPMSEALSGVLGSWVGIFGSGASELAFYRRYMGIDHPGPNLVRMAEGLLDVLLVLAPALLVDRFFVQRSLGLRIAAAATFACSATAIMALQDRSPIDWLNIARFLPFVALGAVAFASHRAIRAGHAERLRWSERSAFALFGLLMMAKILLMVMLAHYGFALALLGAMIFGIVTLEWLPTLVGGRAMRGPALRLTALGLIGTTAFGFWRLSEETFAAMNVRVGEGSDMFLADETRGTGVNALLDVIDTHLAPEETLLVLPEGVMVNYLSRRRTPSRHLNFMPPELEIFGEEEILDALRAEPAAAVALVHKDTSEYGLPLFGTHYGRQLMRWTYRGYRAAWAWGMPPLVPGSVFGIRFMPARESRFSP